jgi:hypothetical protein
VLKPGAKVRHEHLPSKALKWRFRFAADLLL